MKSRSTVISLITIICGFYLYELFDSGIIGTFGLYGIELLKSTNEWYRLVTVALVHDNSNTLPIHLAFNMLALHSLGTPIEQFMGRSKFLIIFFLSLEARSFRHIALVITDIQSEHQVRSLVSSEPSLSLASV